MAEITDEEGCKIEWPETVAEFYGAKKPVPPEEAARFREALEAFQKWNRAGSMDDGSRAFALRSNSETIRLALKIAERLCGEPSQKMICAAWDAERGDVDLNEKEVQDLFKAMRDQLLKECEDK